MSEPIEFINVAEANARFDREHGRDFQPIRCGFNPSALIRRGKLTDKKIWKYEQAGYYSAAFKEARKELWKRNAAKRRSGNFDLTDDGRMIYRPS